MSKNNPLDNMKVGIWANKVCCSIRLILTCVVVSALTISCFPNRSYDFVDTDFLDLDRQENVLYLLISKSYIHTESDKLGHNTYMEVNKSEVYFAEIGIEELLKDDDLVRFNKVGEFSKGAPNINLVLDEDVSILVFSSWMDCVHYKGACNSVFVNKTQEQLNLELYENRNDKFFYDKKTFRVEIALSTKNALKVSYVDNKERIKTTKKIQFIDSGDYDFPLVIQKNKQDTHVKTPSPQ